MKKILLIILFSVSLSTFANSNDKIAFIDIDFVLSQSKAGKSVLSNLDKLNKNINEDQIINWDDVDFNIKDETINYRKQMEEKFKSLLV